MNRKRKSRGRGTKSKDIEQAIREEFKKLTGKDTEVIIIKHGES